MRVLHRFVVALALFAVALAAQAGQVFTETFRSEALGRDYKYTIYLPDSYAKSGSRLPTVYVLHGWSGNASQLRAFVDPLVARGFHVVAVDLPAHGRTAGNFATLPMMADTVASLARRLTPKLVVAPRRMRPTWSDSRAASAKPQDDSKRTARR